MVVTVLKLCALLEERYGRGGRFSQVERSFVLFGAAKFRYEPSSFGARVSQSMYCTALYSTLPKIPLDNRKTHYQNKGMYLSGERGGEGGPAT